MSELNCNKCLYYELDGDELPCRICTLEKDFFRPDPKKVKTAAQDTPAAEPEDDNDDDTSGAGGATAANLAEDAYEIPAPFINTGVLHVHFHFHTEGGACSA